MPLHARSVVAGEDHERFLVQAQRLELVQQHVRRPVDRRHGAAVGAIFRFAQEALGGVVGQVDVHVGEVEEKRRGALRIVAHKPDGFLDVSLGDTALVGLRLDYRFIPQEG